VLVCLRVQEFDCHMDSDGHAANMKVMSAVYQDKNKQLLTKTVDSKMMRKSPGADR